MSEQVSYVRSDSIAISYETRKGLRYVARALGMAHSDALAEDILRQWLQSEHPDVVQRIEDLDAAEGKFERELKAKLNPDPFASKS